MKINQKQKEVKSLGISSGLYEIQNEVAAVALEQLKLVIDPYGLNLLKETSTAQGLTGCPNELFEVSR